MLIVHNIRSWVLVIETMPQEDPSTVYHMVTAHLVLCQIESQVSFSGSYKKNTIINDFIFAGVLLPLHY